MLIKKNDQILNKVQLQNNNYKLNQQQINTIKDILTTKNNLYVSIGTVVVQLQQYQILKQNLIQQYGQLQKKQQQFANKLKQKYGQGRIDTSNWQLIKNQQN